MIKLFINFIQTLFKVQTVEVSIPKVDNIAQLSEYTPKPPISVTRHETPNKQTHSGVRDIKYII